jgi:hypothetical protein
MLVSLETGGQACAESGDLLNRKSGTLASRYPHTSLPISGLQPVLNTRRRATGYSVDSGETTSRANRPRRVSWRSVSNPGDALQLCSF